MIETHEPSGKSSPPPRQIFGSSLFKGIQPNNPIWGLQIFGDSVWRTGTAAPVQTKRNSVVATRQRRNSQVDALEERDGLLIFKDLGEMVSIQNLHLQSSSFIYRLYRLYQKNQSAKITLVFQYL